MYSEYIQIIENKEWWSLPLLSPRIWTKFIELQVHLYMAYSGNNLIYFLLCVNVYTYMYLYTKRQQHRDKEQVILYNIFIIKI